MPRRGNVGVTALLVVLLTQPSSALAQSVPSPTPCSVESLVCADGEVRENQVDIGAADGSGGAAAVDRGGNAEADPARCTFHAVPDVFDQETHPVVQDGIPRGAVWYVRNCGGSDEYRWYLPGTSAPDDEVVRRMVERALDTVEPPTPQLVTSPPLGSEVVTGLPVYMAVDDAAFSEHTGTVSAGQFTVTATVTPVSTWFSPGDSSDPRSCEGAGTVWSTGDRPSETDCTHTFTHTPADMNGAGHAFTLTSRVTYEASYTVTGPVFAGTYGLGTFEGPEATVEVPVIERRAVRTAAG